MWHPPPPTSIVRRHRPCMPPPAPVAYQPPLSDTALVWASTPWCGGGWSKDNIQVNTNSTPTVNAPVDSRQRIMGNGNTRDSGNTRISTYAPTTSNTRIGQQPDLIKPQTCYPAPCPTPIPPTPSNVCPTGQPAGKAGNGAGYYAQPGWSNTGGTYHNAPSNGWSNTSRAALTGNVSSGGLAINAAKNCP